jgi:hypothetical protein
VTKRHQHDKIDLSETHTSHVIVFLGVRPCQLIVVRSKQKNINLLKTLNLEVQSDETKTCPMAD